MGIFNIFKPNDWKIVYSDTATTNVHYVRDYDHYWQYEHSFYSIEYSYNRQKYRLVCSGYKPYKHKFYGEMLRKLAEYNTDKVKNN